MKLILYILALVSIAGAAGFSMQNIKKHEEQLTLTKEEKEKVRLLKKQVAKKTEERDSEESLRAAAKNKNNELISLIDVSKKPELMQLTDESSKLNSGLSELQERKEEITQAMLVLREDLQDEAVPLDGVEEYVTGLENKKKNLNKENKVLNDELAVFDGQVKQNNAVLTDFKAAQLKRRKNLGANKVSSLITAVDNEWGFVVIKPHADAVIKQESKLVVIRGNKHVGRLTINAIEGDAGRVLANIDYSSLSRGMRIRPGDRVILSKPLTQ